MRWNLTFLWRFFSTAVALATVFAAVGSFANVWWLSLFFIGLGLGWWINNSRRQVNENIPFMLFLAVAAYSGFRGTDAIWLLFAGIFALMAWDLDNFLRQLTAVMITVGEELMVKAHCQQLALVAGISFLAGLIALLIQLNLSYAVAFILAFLAIWGLGLLLSQVVENY